MPWPRQPFGSTVWVHVWVHGLGPRVGPSAPDRWLKSGPIGPRGAKDWTMIGRTIGRFIERLDERFDDLLNDWANDWKIGRDWTIYCTIGRTLGRFIERFIERLDERLDDLLNEWTNDWTIY